MIGYAPPLRRVNLNHAYPGVRQLSSLLAKKRTERFPPNVGHLRTPAIGTKRMIWTTSGAEQSRPVRNLCRGIAGF